MISASNKNSINNDDIAIINTVLAQVCAATFIQINSEEGQALANSAVREYLTGRYDQKQLADLMLTRIHMADKLNRKAERLSTAHS